MDPFLGGGERGGSVTSARAVVPELAREPSKDRVSTGMAVVGIRPFIAANSMAIELAQEHVTDGPSELPDRSDAWAIPSI